MISLKEWLIIIKKLMISNNKNTIDILKGKLKKSRIMI